MINGRINRVMEAARLEADRDCSNGCSASAEHGEEEAAERRPTDAGGRQATRRGRQEPAARSRVYISNPAMPTRWSQPVPAAQIETAARTRRPAPEPAATATAPAVELGRSHRGGAAPVIVAGTLDTKGDELRFIRDQIAAAGVRVVSSTSRPPASRRRPTCRRTMSRRIIRGGPKAVFTGERGTAVTAMAEAFEALGPAPAAGSAA